MRRRVKRGPVRLLAYRNHDAFPFHDLAWNPRRREFLLASSRYGDVLLTRLDSQGNRVGEQIPVVTSHGHGSAIATTERGRHLLTYSVGNHAYYQRIGRRLRLGPARRVSTASTEYVDGGAVVTTTPTGFGLAWVQALGPDDPGYPNYSLADREIFYRGVNVAP